VSRILAIRDRSGRNARARRMTSAGGDTPFEEAQRVAFDEVARRYDNRWLRSTWPRNVETRAATVERLLGPAVGGSVVEVGCGTGQMGELLVERNPGMRYVGLDLSEEMLELARGRLGRFGDRVELRQVHGALDLEPDAYEGAFGVDVLHHVEHPAGVLAEVCRGLAPGGRVVFLEGNPRFPVTALLGLLQRHERGLLRIGKRSLTSWASTAGFVDVSASWGPTYTPPAPPALGRALDRVDGLCARVPGVRALALHVVLEARKPPA
jgi:ubiquinone/menaquinone biosynthesis C-methylase UbiE